jgi:signal transduction histidine kinase/CheY-like chemotaxis protein
MKTKTRLYFYTVAGFVTGIFLLIVIQYTTHENVENLISANEDLVKQYKMSSSLAELERDLLFIEDRIKLAAITGDPDLMSNFGPRIREIKKDEVLLERHSDPVNLADIRKLNQLVDQRIALDSARSMIAGADAGRIGDSIRALIAKIDTTGKIVLAQKIRSVDSNGQKVQRWNQFVAVLVILLIAGIFVMLIGRMKKQTGLIEKLNESERRLKAAALVKENFLANMSHEIRTPLNAILGYTELIRRKRLDAETSFHAKTIHQSGETLLGIVNDILDLSKIESGMMRVEDAPFSLSGLVYSVTTMLNHKAEEKGIKLAIRFSQDIPDLITGDAARLTQILVNLIGNAVKFTHNGEVVLDISGQQTDPEHIKISFSVKDSGIGIEEEKLETIFERFRQAEDATTRKFGGTGLGLSIARDLVHLQNGTIEIKSKPGTGTTVLVAIPYKITTSLIDVPGSESSLQFPRFRSGIKVLIVEDNEINQGLMSRLIEGWGLGYTIADNGKEALKMLKKEHFDLVLMDIQMPEMDGYTATREIRDTLKLNVPIIAMTAHAMAGEREKCISSGMNEHIPKPVRENMLYKVLTGFLGGEVFENNTHTLNGHSYKVIDLAYMKEISNGDPSYEKLATNQFLSLVPEALELLLTASSDDNPALLKRIAHNLKSTISIMGLDTVLSDDLDALIYDDHDKAGQRRRIIRVESVCREAMEEAQYFLTTLH